MKDTFLKLMFIILKNYIRFMKNDEEEKLHENDLPFLAETMKIGKFEKHLANVHHKTFVIHKKFKTSIRSWISFKKSL